MRRDDFTYPRVSKAAFQLAIPGLFWVTAIRDGTSSNEAGDSGDDRPDGSEWAATGSAASVK